MKKYLFLLFSILSCCNLFAQQCVGNQSYTLNPPGPYSPGQIVNVSYTLDSWTQVNINWIIAFDIDYGNGWTSISPVSAPGNPGGVSGNWIWDNQNTYPSGVNFGPGYRFQNNNNPNWGTSSTGPFTLSFDLVVGNSCINNDLSINISVLGDCQTGGWNNGACCPPSMFNIYSGNSVSDTVFNSHYVDDCSNFLWGLNNQTYFQSGIYIYNSLNSFGCPQVDSLYLSLGTEGCTDSNACNYDSLSLCDDGSCIYDISSPVIINTCTDLSDGAVTVNLNQPVSGSSYFFSVDGSSLTQYFDTISGLSSGYYDYEFFIDGVSCGHQTIEILDFPLINYSINSVNETCQGTSDGIAYINSLGGNSNTNGTISTLSYCSSNPNFNFLTNPQAIIQDVELIGDNINISNNTSLISDFYEDYTYLYADVTQGQTYTINVTLGNMGFQAYDPEEVNIYIDFNIDGDFTDPGENLGSFNIPFGTWNPSMIFPFTFTVPSNSQIGPTRIRVVCMGNAGSNTTMGPCESPSGFDPPWFGATEDYSLVINGNNNYTYLWSNGSFSDSITGLSSGQYNVVISDQNGCSTIDSVIIDTSYSLSVNTSADQTICHGGDPAQISSATNSSNCSFYWSPSSDFIDPNSQNPNFSSGIYSTTVYYVTATDLNSCTATDSIVINVNPVPNVTLNINPNPACLNDTIQLFAVTSIPLNLYRFQYNNGNGWQNIITTNGGGWGNINPQFFNSISSTTQFRVRVREWWGCTVSSWSPTISVPVNLINTPLISHN